MEKMNRDRNSQPFVSLENVYPRSDLLILIDLCCVIAINRKQPVYDYTHHIWSSIFPSFLMFSPAVSRDCSKYYRTERRTIEAVSKRIAEEKDISNPSSIIKILTITTALLVISEYGRNTVDPENIGQMIFERLSGVFKDTQTLEKSVSSLMSLYFSEGCVISRETYDKLNEYSSRIQNVHDLFCRKLEVSGNNERIISPVQFMKVLCLMYLALEEKNASQKTRDECIWDQFPKIFGNSSSDPEKTIQELNRIIETDDFLRYQNLLFEYPFYEIRSGLIARTICLMLCVNMAIISADDPDSESVANEALALFAKFFGDISAGYEEKDISRYVRRIYASDHTIDDRLTKILLGCSDTVKNIFAMVVSKKEPERRKQPSEHPCRRPGISEEDDDTISPVKFMQVLCLMYLALEEKNASPKTREECILGQFPKIFGNSSSDPEKTIRELNRIIETDDFLRCQNWLFEYPFHEIRSGLIVRTICSVLCVNMVIISVNNLNSEYVENEALTLFAKFFSDISAGYEEEDISKYVGRISTANHTIDDRLPKILFGCSDTVKTMFKTAGNYSRTSENAMLSIKKESGRRKQLFEHQRQKKKKKKQVYTTKANTVYELIQKLTEPSYDYILNRLYRFAYGFDELPYEELKSRIRELIQILQLFGVYISHEELVNCELTEELCKKETINIREIADMPENRVVFPGWKVSGDTVCHPTASK